MDSSPVLRPGGTPHGFRRAGNAARHHLAPLWQIKRLRDPVWPGVNVTMGDVTERDGDEPLLRMEKEHR